MHRGAGRRARGEGGLCVAQGGAGSPPHTQCVVQTERGRPSLPCVEAAANLRAEECGECETQNRSHFFFSRCSEPHASLGPPAFPPSLPPSLPSMVRRLVLLRAPQKARQSKTGSGECGGGRRRPHRPRKNDAPIPPNPPQADAAKSRFWGGDSSEDEDASGSSGSSSADTSSSPSDGTSSSSSSDGSSSSSSSDSSSSGSDSDSDAPGRGKASR